MMKILAVVLCVAVPAMAQAPADAPLADVPATSTRLAEGDRAPYAGYLISDAEDVRRAKKEADERVTLQTATGSDVLLPKAAVAALISAGAAAVISSIVLGVALAAKK